MKAIKHYFIFIHVIFFSGCAIMNTSLTETAETLKPLRVRVGVEWFNGPDLGESLKVVDSAVDSVFRKQVPTNSLLGIKAGIGIFPHFEINIKGWITGGNTGSRVYGKLGFFLDRDSSWAVALIPGYNRIESKYDENIFNNKHDDNFLKSTGWEIIFVSSYKIEDKLTFYGAFRYAEDALKITGKTIENILNLQRTGILGGISLKAYPFYLRPEVGLEFITHDGLSPKSVFIYGIGLGLEF